MDPSGVARLPEYNIACDRQAIMLLLGKNTKVAMLMRLTVWTGYWERYTMTLPEICQRALQPISIVVRTSLSHLKHGLITAFPAIFRGAKDAILRLQIGPHP